MYYSYHIKKYSVKYKYTVEMVIVEKQLRLETPYCIGQTTHSVFVADDVEY